MTQLIDFVLHIDAHLVNIVNQFGNWTYVILFAIIFVETGAVILPFLPGDSLLFAAAALDAPPAQATAPWPFRQGGGTSLAGADPENPSPH